MRPEAAVAAVPASVEPVFALYYTRRSKSLSEGEFKVWHPLVREYMKVFHITDEKSLPPYFVTAHQITVVVCAILVAIFLRLARRSRS